MLSDCDSGTHRKDVGEGWGEDSADLETGLQAREGGEDAEIAPALSALIRNTAPEAGRLDLGTLGLDCRGCDCSFAWEEGLRDAGTGGGCC